MTLTIDDLLPQDAHERAAYMQKMQFMGALYAEQIERDRAERHQRIMEAIDACEPQPVAIVRTVHRNGNVFKLINGGLNADM